jgi:hypothetical protein
MRALHHPPQKHRAQSHANTKATRALRGALVTQEKNSSNEKNPLMRYTPGYNA